MFLHSPTSFINSFDLPCTTNPTESFVSKIKLKQQLRNIPRWRSFNSIFKPAKQYVSSKLDLSTCRAFLISFLFVLSSSLSSPFSATFYPSASIKPPLPFLIFIPCFFQPSHALAHSTNLRGSNNLPYAQPGIYSPKRDIANFMETSRTSFTDSSFERLSLQDDAMCRKKLAHQSSNRLASSPPDVPRLRGQSAGKSAAFQRHPRSREHDSSDSVSRRDSCDASIKIKFARR